MKTRPVKYRYWDPDKKEMVYLSHMSWGHFWDSVDQTYDGSPELMQCVDLKDKNGKDIYEGDIVCCSNESLEQTYNIEMTLEIAFAEVRQYAMEVVGNVFNDPQLLD